MHFLITAGGTREYIDPVRFISNASSGKMGYALARAALKASHKVTLVTAPANLRPPGGAKLIHVETTGEMFAAVKAHFGKCDCLIMAAAVSDYAPARPAKQKIKKTDKELALRLRPTTDILKWAGRKKKVRSKQTRGRRQIVVGFSLEDADIRSNAEKKLKAKNLDMIIANTPAAIGADKASIEAKVHGEQWVEFAVASKAIIAKRIISMIETMR